MLDLKNLLFILLLLVAVSSVPMTHVQGSVNNPGAITPMIATAPSGSATAVTTSQNQATLRTNANTAEQVHRPTPSIQPVITPAPMNQTHHLFANKPSSAKTSKPTTIPAAAVVVSDIPIKNPDIHGSTTIWHRHIEGISYHSMPNATMQIDFMAPAKTHARLLMDKHVAVACVDPAGKIKAQSVWISSDHAVVNWPTRMTADCYLQWMS